MFTTTIRLPAELKERVTRAAERAGQSAHSFILDAITEKAAQEELRELRDTAQERYAAIAESGETVPWNDMREYLERRIAGTKASRPKLRKMAR